MRPNNTVHRVTVAATLLIAVTTIVLAATPDELDAVRQECIAAAQDVQQHERAIATLDRDIDLLGRDADARRRGLDESRPQQARLLATLAYIARQPPGGRVTLAEAPIDRVRSELLMNAAAPALNALTRALSTEIRRTAALRQQIVAKQAEAETARQTLATERDRLAALIARRLELTRQLLPEEAAAAARIARVGREAKDIDELIRNADAATDRRDKELLARSRPAPARRQSPPASQIADPTRPGELRTLVLNADDPNPAALAIPVAGTVTRRFGETDASGAVIAGASLTAPAGAQIVAPFDGRVEYAGVFRDLGLVLIIRHAGGYHSVLTGLGRVDTKSDQWVLAGEPVGAMPDAPNGALYFELRRDGRPVDPQPWMVTREDGRGERAR